MPNLLVKGKKPGADGLALSITPESAGWKYVGFQVYRRAAGETLDWKIGGRESCLVLLSGKASASIDGKAPVDCAVFPRAPGSQYVISLSMKFGSVMISGSPLNTTMCTSRFSVSLV